MYAASLVRPNNPNRLKQNKKRAYDEFSSADVGALQKIAFPGLGAGAHIPGSSGDLAARFAVNKRRSVQVGSILNPQLPQSTIAVTVNYDRKAPKHIDEAFDPAILKAPHSHHMGAYIPQRGEIIGRIVNETTTEYNSGHPFTPYAKVISSLNSLRTDQQTQVVGIATNAQNGTVFTRDKLGALNAGGTSDTINTGGDYIPFGAKVYAIDTPNAIETESNGRKYIIPAVIFQGDDKAAPDKFPFHTVSFRETDIIAMFSLLEDVIKHQVKAEYARSPNAANPRFLADTADSLIKQLNLPSAIDGYKKFIQVVLHREWFNAYVMFSNVNWKNAANTDPQHPDTTLQDAVKTTVAFMRSLHMNSQQTRRRYGQAVRSPDYNEQLFLDPVADVTNSQATYDNCGALTSGQILALSFQVNNRMNVHQQVARNENQYYLDAHYLGKNIKGALPKQQMTLLLGAA